MAIPKSVSLNDLAYSLALAGSPAADLGLGVFQGQGIVTISQQVNLTASTKAASGTATAPGAGATIASLAIATAGYYKVQVVVGFGGTAESTAIDNFKFGGTSGITASTIPVQNTANYQSQTFEFYSNLSVGNLNVVANAAGSAGAVYKATILATRQF